MDDKVTVEENAINRLAKFCGYDINYLEHKDKPDIHHKSGKIGIEVVQDCYPNEKMSESDVRRIWEMPYNQIPEYIVGRIKKAGGSLVVENNRIKMAHLGIQTPNNPEHLIETIKKKIDLLKKKRYKYFDIYELYVFVDTVSLFESYVVQVMQEITEYDVKLPYSKIYLDGYFEICICELKNSKYKRISTREK